MRNFALTGVDDCIVPRHLRVVKDTGNEFIACLDKVYSVGVIDSCFPDANFFCRI